MACLEDCKLIQNMNTDEAETNFHISIDPSTKKERLFEI
jgi:hypothetical protein